MNLLESIEKAGVVGCGGAGFPAHIKWKAKAEYLIVNAVECEPLLATDKYLLRHRAQDMITACCKVAEILEAKNTAVAIKGAYTEEIAALEAAIQALSAKVEIHKMDSFYPAGDEQVIVYEVTGRVVPCGGIPLDVGAVVSNVATLIAAYEAMDGKPLIDKYITVAGEVKKPTIIKAPVGTPVAACIEAAGGAVIDDYLIVAGGPMMGKEISCEPEKDQLVTKTTSGILVLPKGGMMETYKAELDLPALKKKAATSCIQCSYCTMLCPRHLLGHPLQPHLIMRSIAFADDMDQLLKSSVPVRNASLCSLCGVCTTYACPMGLQPSKVNALLKDELGKRGIRRETKETTEPLFDREWRKVPTGRISARAGVMDYHGSVGGGIVELEPKEVAISLRQGPGKLPEPVVAAGDTVERGMVIASIPAGAMGANLHASISGTVTEVSDVIRIRR